MKISAEIAKLESLYEQGILTEDELNASKEALLFPYIDSDRKSRVSYVIFALFLGIFGAHNFYAGRWKRGLCQLLLTLLTCFIGGFFVKIWALVNIFTIKTDGNGKPFIPGKKLDYILGTLAYLIYFLLLVVGILSGIGLVAVGYRVDRYIQSVQHTASTHYISFPTKCVELVPMDENIGFENCMVYPDGRMVLGHVAENIQDRLLLNPKVKRINPSTIMIPADYGREQ